MNPEWIFFQLTNTTPKGSYWTKNEQIIIFRFQQK